jgi:uncharacterized membrane protein YvbJ
MFCEKCGEQTEEKNTFCPSCGASLVVETFQVPSDPVTKKKYRKRALVSLLAPVFAFVLIIVLLGLINLISDLSTTSSGVMFMNNIVVPLLFGLIVLASPVGVVLAIYFYLKSRD